MWCHPVLLEDVLYQSLVTYCRDSGCQFLVDATRDLIEEGLAKPPLIKQFFARQDFRKGPKLQSQKGRNFTRNIRVVCPDEVRDQIERHCDEFHLLYTSVAIRELLCLGLGLNYIPTEQEKPTAAWIRAQRSIPERTSDLILQMKNIDPYLSNTRIAEQLGVSRQLVSKVLLRCSSLTSPWLATVD